MLKDISMRTITLFIALTLCVNFGLQAQIEAVIGTGTSTNTSTGYPAPYGNYYYGARHQMLITAAEILAAGGIPGNILSLGFDVASANGVPLHDFEMKIGTTTANNISTWESGLTTVFSSLSYTETAGWNMHPFSQPFFWDGVSNLIIETCFNNNGYTSNAFTYYSNTSFVSTLVYRTDNSGVCTSTSISSSHSVRPNMKITFAPNQGVDAGISDIVGLNSPAMSGLNNVRGLMRNYGQDTITSVNLGWSVNGVSQTPQVWNGSLASQQADTVLFGSFNFPSGTNNLTVWTFLPNNTVDSNTFNDSASSSVYFCNLYGGTYTVGGSGADFPDITTAVNDIASCGIYSPVILNINPGTYNEQVSVPEIPGSSSVNTFTLQSASGNAADVIITFNYTGSNYTFRFDGADYVRLQNLTLEASGTYYSRVVVLENGANHNVINGCKIISNPQARTSFYSAGIYDASGLDEYNTFTNNEIENGYYGIHLYGTSTSLLQAGNIVENNTLSGFQYSGVYGYYLQAPVFNHNQLENHPASGTSYGLSCIYSQHGQEVIGNRVNLLGTSTQYGLYIYYCTATDSTMGLVANNMVSITGNNTSANFGLYSYYSHYQRYYHNSVNIATGSTSAYASYFYYGSNSHSVNNLFSNTVGGTAVHHYGSSLSVADYNNYLSSGSNLAYWGTMLTDLPALQAVSGQDLHSVSVFPAFLMPDALYPRSTAMDNLGNPLPEVTEDMDGNIRSLTTPDIGCVEFSPLQTGAMIDLSTALINLDTLMATRIITDSLLVYNNGSDSLHITGFNASEPGFIPPALPFSVRPYDSAWMYFSYEVTGTGQVDAVIQLPNNDEDTLFTVSVFVFPKPVLSSQPSPLNVSMQGCDDSLQVSLSIQNTYMDSLKVNIWSQELSSDAHLQILAYNLGTSTYREYPNTLSALNQFFTNYSLSETKTTSVDALRKALENKDVMLITEPSSASTSVFTNLAPAMQEFAERGGRIIFCGTSNVNCIFNTGLLSGSYATSNSNPLTVINPGHPFTEDIPTSFSGPVNTYSCYFTNADLIRLVDAQNGMVSVYRHYGAGLVAYVGFDFSYINDDAARLLANLVSKPYAAYGGMSAGQLMLPVSATGSIQIDFKGNGTISGLYPGKIFLAAPEIGWYDTLDYSFELIGNPAMVLTEDTLRCQPTIQGASSINEFKVYNTGCDTLFITAFNSSDSAFVPLQPGLQVLPFDSNILYIAFEPVMGGLNQANLLIENNHLNSTMVVEGMGLSIPHLDFSADTVSALFHQCHDTLNESVYIVNSGMGILEYQFEPSSGTIYDSTSTQYFSFTGQQMTHTFFDLPLTVDTLKLVFTINGDYDGGTEYVDLYIDGTYVGRINGGATNTDITSTFSFTGQQVNDWLVDGILQVDMNNSGAVNTGYGTNLNQAQLLLKDLPLFELNPMAASIAPLDSLPLNIMFTSGAIPNGTYLRKAKVNSNDPSDPMDTLWLKVTIDNPVLLAVDSNALDFGAVSRDVMEFRTLEVFNHGSDVLSVYLHTSDSVFTTMVDSLLLPPCGSAQVEMVFTPDSVGSFSEYLFLTSAGGNIQIPLSGIGMGRPEIVVNPMQFNIKLIDTANYADTLVITNTGDDTLHCNLSNQKSKALVLFALNKANLSSCSNLKGDKADDYIKYLENEAAIKSDALWLNTSLSSLSIPPGYTATVLLYFTGSQMTVGFNAANLLIQSNDPVNPQLIIPVSAERAFKNFTTYDNNNNALQDIPDGDMDVYLCRNDGVVPIEFNIFVEDTAFTNGQLSIYNYDIDETSGEIDHVYLNGNFLGSLTGANNQWSTSVFTFPGAYLNPGPNGKNVVRIEVDVTQTGWCTTIDWGQIVTDNTPSGSAFIRYATPNQNIYLPGENIQVSNEIDALSGTMAVRVETNLLDSNQVNVDGISRNLNISGSNDEPFTESLSFPSGSYFGKYYVQVIVYDAITYVQQDIRYVEIERGLPPIGLGLQGGEVCPDDTVIVSVTAQNLDQVAAFMLNLHYADSLATYLGYQNLNPALAGGTVTVSSGNKHLFFDYQAPGSISMVNGLLVELTFRLAKGNSAIAFDFGTPNPTRFIHQSGYVFHLADSSISDSLLTFPGAIITQHPTDLNVLVDGLSVFTITAERADQYIWERSVDNGLTYQAITDTSVLHLGSTLMIPSTPATMDGHRFRCAVVDSCGDTLISQSALLSVVYGSGANIKVFLQAAWQSGKGSMRTTLKDLPDFPLTQPYNEAPWYYAGNETIDSATQNMVDWVLVELRSTPDTIIERKAGILLADGSIVAPNMTSALQFMHTGNYYLTIRHHNHLSVMSADPVSIPYLGTHDFTDTNFAQPYGGVGSGVIELESGVFGMILGDIQQDGNLKYSGALNDRAPILTRILNVVGGTSITSTTTGYYREDLNMDGVLKYSGQNNDQARIILNIISLKGSTSITSIFIGPVPVGVMAP